MFLFHHLHSLLQRLVYGNMALPMQEFMGVSVFAQAGIF